jgi:hypothetical protein
MQPHATYRSRWAPIFLVALLLSSVASISSAAVVGYNGDPDLYSGLHNSYNGDYFPYITEFDDFDVTSNITLTDVFSNNFMNYTGVTEAHWEIRTGVSAGNGGTVVAGGFSVATQSLNGFGIPGGSPLYTGYKINVDITSYNVQLTPGKYWLSVAPKALGPGTGASAFLYTTSGANAVGTPAGDNGHAYVFADNPNADPDTVFANASVYHSGQHVDYSLGFAAIPTVSTVPEPSTMFTYLGLAAVFYVGNRFRRRPTLATAV